jgi:hypothetical protein
MAILLMSFGSSVHRSCARPWRDEYGEDEQQDDQISAEKSVVKLKIGDEIKLTERLSWRFSRHSLPRLKPSSSSRLPTRFRLDGWPQSFRYLVRDIVLDHQDIV